MITQVRLVEEDASYTSYGEAYEVNCARYGREPDAPIVHFKKRICDPSGQLQRDVAVELRQQVGVWGHWAPPVLLGLNVGLVRLDAAPVHWCSFTRWTLRKWRSSIAAQGPDHSSVPADCHRVTSLAGSAVGCNHVHVEGCHDPAVRTAWQPGDVLGISASGAATRHDVQQPKSNHKFCTCCRLTLRLSSAT